MALTLKELSGDREHSDMGGSIDSYKRGRREQVQRDGR